MAAVGLREKPHPFGDKINPLCLIVIPSFFKKGSSKNYPYLGPIFPQGFSNFKEDPGH